MILEEYYKLYNNASMVQYEKQKEKLAELTEIKAGRGVKEAVARFVKEQAEFLLRLISWEEKANEDYFRSASLSELASDQDKLFGEEEEQYPKTSLCPAWLIRPFGPELGPVLSHIAYRLRDNITYAYRHMRFAMCWNQELMLETAKILMKSAKDSTGELTELLRANRLEHARELAGIELHEHYIFDPCHGEDWIRKSDLQDPGVLYCFGVRVHPEDLELARFMNGLPEEKIDQMARSFVEGYRKGFFADGKDIVRKKTVGIRHRLGMERMTRRAMELFESEIHYIPFISQIQATQKNQQFQYDHRFDLALVFNEDYGRQMNEALETELEENREVLDYYGGPAAIGSFGEAQFTPRKGKGNITFHPNQTEAYSAYRSRRSELIRRYMPERETSFTMVAYPAAQIGPDFPEIFEETVRINTLDNEKYQQVQQHIIDALDQGVEVEIQGASGNETQLRVALQPIEDPKKQTNFYNCVADVNIPLGEVFTSPQLKATNGTLHVESFYTDGMRFENLKLIFEDGYVTSYSCSNYESEEDNRKYVQDNLLFPHETLPMGEFAIGTNTLAYKMAMKYGIVEQLPILIVEKMGPHFAIGDTCYTETEDLAVYNPKNGKEIVARENEKTALRSTDYSQAYTHMHTDITLPYHGIGLIRVKTASGQMIEIIRGGRFVLRGTELLNEALRALEEEEAEQNEGQNL